MLILRMANRFVYLGIPQFVLDWRPSRPGPKMSVFLAVTTTLTGLYVYDRTETKRIQQEYIARVNWMSEQTLGTTERARKVTVLGARVPEDGELERGAKWFKRYMRVCLSIHRCQKTFRVRASLTLSRFSRHPADSRCVRHRLRPQSRHQPGWPRSHSGARDSRTAHH